MKKASNKKIFGLWRKLVNFWTLVFVVGIVYDFVTNNSIKEEIEVMGIIYVGVLAIYVGNKEFERWHATHKSTHPGELFIIFWTILVFAILALDIIFQKSYELPGSVVSSYVAVLTILAITSKSKKLYQEKKSKKIK